MESKDQIENKEENTNVNTTKLSSVFLIPPAMYVNLSWLYCELTDEKIAPVIKSGLHPCKICGLFRDLFSYFAMKFVTVEHRYKYICRFIENIFATTITQEQELKVRRLSLLFIYKAIKKINTSVAMFCSECGSKTKT